MKKSEASENVARRKVPFRFQFSTFIFQLAALLLLVGLVSCDNFLHSSSDFKEKLEQDIEYAESTPYEIRMECDEGLGSITSISILSKKVTDQFNVEFKIASGVQFVCWKAYSKSSDGTYSELSSDYIDFISYNTESNDGVYKATVKFVKAAVGIVIKPYCQILPKVAAITPKSVDEYPAGFSQDTTVKITFNKAVDTSTFDSDFSCISIKKADGTDLRADGYFDTPYFSSENTVLNIPIKKGKFILPLDSTDTADITLSFNFTNEKDLEGNVITSHENYTYRVNGSVDNVPPVVSSVEIATTSDSDAWYYRTLTDTAFEDWSDEEVKDSDGTNVKYFFGDYSRNYVSERIHISLQGYDNTDSVSKVWVREVFEKTATGTAVDSNKTESAFDEYNAVTDASGNVVLNESGNSLYAFDFDYTFRTTGDGLVRLEIYIADQAGNVSEVKKYWMIKKVMVNRIIDFMLKLDGVGIFPSLIDGKYKSHIHIDTDDARTGHFYVQEAEKIYLDYQGACSKFAIYFYDETDSPQEVFAIKNFLLPNPSGNTYEEKRDIGAQFEESLKNVLVDSYREIKAKAVFYEENGLTQEFDMTIPKGPDGIAISNGNLSTDSGIINSNNCYVTYQTDENSPVTKTWSNSTSDNADLSKIVSTEESTDYPYGLYKVYSKTNRKINYLGNWYSYITSAYGKPYVHLKKSSAQSAINLPFTIKNKIYEKSTGMAKIELEVSYPDDGNVYYIVAQNTVAPNSDTPPEVYYSAGNSKFIEIPNGYTYTLKVECKKTNEGFIGYTDSVTVALTDEDNFPPKIFNYTSFDYYNSAFVYCSRANLIDVIAGKTTEVDLDIKDFTCYYTKTNLGYTLSASELEKIEKASVDKKTITFEHDPEYPEYPNIMCAKIPLSDIEQGEYFLYGYFTDKKGNGIFEQILKTSYGNGLYFNLIDETPEIVKNSDRILELKCTQGYCKRYKLEYKEGKWRWMDADNGDRYEFQNDTKDYDGYTSGGTFYPGTKDHFIMAMAYEFSSEYGRYGRYHLKPLFYYPNYINGDFTCKSTSWLKVANGYQIFCDRPAFCHTLYSARKITTDASEAAALEWEAQAQETGIVVSEDGSNFTYKDSNLAEIPSGYYYTTIVHFADGTVLMSDVKQK